MFKLKETQLSAKAKNFMFTVAASFRKKPHPLFATECARLGAIDTSCIREIDIRIRTLAEVTHIQEYIEGVKQRKIEAERKLMKRYTALTKKYIEKLSTMDRDNAEELEYVSKLRERIRMVDNQRKLLTSYRINTMQVPQCYDYFFATNRKTCFE